MNRIQKKMYEKKSNSIKTKEQNKSKHVCTAKTKNCIPASQKRTWANRQKTIICKKKNLNFKNNTQTSVGINKAAAIYY